jgi:hypothetical protein
MKSKENNTQQSNVDYINKISTINNLNIQKENSNVYTVNNQFKTIYMYIPNKINK